MFLTDAIEELIYINKNINNNHLIASVNTTDNKVNILMDHNSQYRTALSVHHFDPELINNLRRYIKKNHQRYMFNSLDKYLMNFLEESSELFESLKHIFKVNVTKMDEIMDDEILLINILNSVPTKNLSNILFKKDGVFDEICDIIIYADIIRYIIKLFTTEEDHKVFESEKLYTKTITDRINVNIYDGILEMNSRLIKIRRNFSVRKWHKPHSELDNLHILLNKDLDSFYGFTMDFMIDLAVYLMMKSGRKGPNGVDDVTMIKEAVIEVSNIIEKKRKEISEGIISSLNKE